MVAALAAALAVLLIAIVAAAWSCGVAVIWLRYVFPGVLVFAASSVCSSPTTDQVGWLRDARRAGLVVLLMNVLFRFGAVGDDERQAEDDAREYFTKHGHWPDEKP